MSTSSRCETQRDAAHDRACCGGVAFRSGSYSAAAHEVGHADLSRPRQLLALLHFWYSLSDFCGYNLSLFPSLDNPMGMINDFCGPDRSEARKASLPPPNCCYMAAKINSWPHIFVVALREIQPGEVLTVDYGDAFWMNFDLLEEMQKVREQGTIILILCTQKLFL